MLRKIQSICFIIGFGILSYLEFTKGHYFMGSLAAFCVFIECLGLILSRFVKGEATVKVAIGREENK